MNKRIIGILIAAMLILLIPIIAMQFTDEVNWTLSDFIIAGILLLSSGFLFELTIRKVKNTGYRIAICTVLLVMLLLFWVELAVGIFGTPLSGY